VKDDQHVELAADATLRAMALRCASTGSRERRPARSDLRTKVRLRTSGSLIVFVIDASDSMSVERRMAMAKGAVMALLVTAEVSGDRVALVSFAGESAELVLPPTASLVRARARLRRLPTGGATPLAAGLARALELIRTERRKDPLVRPCLVLSSDGEANVPRRAGVDVAADVDAVANEIRKEGIAAVVLDTNARFACSASLRRLAGRIGAEYRAVHDLDAGDVVGLVRGLEPIPSR
jgi:magnesium chelatase subunit D